ncbi:Germin protein [Dioscorea alata]|uniref:Germin protein n=1 Tax=Dioscorea alata TaxID=55571 RepID=A0ACB7WE36_DIOAL|nr:Germin protein [Dioscorea alata]
MAGQTTTATTLFLLLSIILMIIMLLDFSYVCHADPDPVDDICIADLSTGQRFANGYPCKPASQVTADDLVSDVLAKEGNTSNVFGSITTGGTVVKFPASTPWACIKAPHTHPRASELVIVVRGTLFIGIVTADNKYFSKVVKKGEMFIVPRGLMHFQCNIGKGKAQTYAAFNSQLPGGISVPKSLFQSTPSIPDGLLSKVFQLDEATVRASKAKLVNI